jgi:hypothetical protein
MRPTFHPQRINLLFSDSGLLGDFLFAKRARLFDLGVSGSIHALSARKLFRISHAFFSHTHMNPFIASD